MKTNNSNPNTRAIVSALRSDYPSLRATAAALVDRAVEDSKRPQVAVMVAFDSSLNTAKSILRERARVTKSGARRKG